jgi:hypothetical protein
VPLLALPSSFFSYF